MKKLVLLSMAVATAFLSLGCANDLTPEPADRPMAGNAADPMGHIPRRQQDPLKDGGWR